MFFYRLKRYFLRFIFLFIRNEKIKRIIIDFVLGKQLGFSSIYEYWSIEKNNDRLLAILEYNYKNKKIDWLIYANVLYEKKQYKKCKKVLEEYLAVNGFEMLDGFLPLSYFAKSIGILSDDVVKSATIFEKINFTDNNKSFQRYVKNKKIAIVGNSNNELGRNKGKEIDNHNVVIRFNNYVLEQYQNDYGKKVNIWIINNTLDIVERNIEEINKLDFIIIRIDIWHNGLTPNIRDIIYDCIVKTNVNIIYIDYKTQKSTQKYSNVNNPTSGILVFHYLNKILKINIKNIDLYGFSFLYEDKTYEYQHYYEKLTELLSKKAIKIGSINLQNDYFIKYYRSKKNV